MNRAQATAPLLARNASLNFATEIGIVAVLVITMPLVMRSLGETAFGLFSLAWIVINYLSFFDVGVSKATTKYLSEHLARGEMEAAGTLVRTSAALNFALGVCGGALVVVVAAPWMLPHLFRVPPEMLAQARWTFLAVAASVPVLLMQGTCRSVLAAFQRFDWNSSVRLATQGTQWIVAYLVARSGHGVAWVVAATVLTRLADVCLYSFLVHKLLPGAFRLSLPRGYAAKLLRFGGWVSVSLLMSPLLVYLDRVMLARFVSLAAVAIYTIPYEAVTRLRILPASVVATLYPAFSERSISADKGAVTRLYAGAVRYLAVVLLPCFSVLVVLGPDVLRLWMGAEFAAQAGRVMQLIALGAMINALAYIPLATLQGVGRPDVGAKIHLIEVPFYFALCLLLIPRYGILGAGWASVVRFAVDSAAIYWAAGRYANCGPRLLLNRAAVLLLGCVVGLNVLLLGAMIASPQTLVRLFAAAALLAAYAALAWKFMLDAQHRPALVAAIFGASAAAGPEANAARAGGQNI